MNILDSTFRQDVMQVCRNGHVITDRLRCHPERGLGQCDRCGAPTLDRCATCGKGLVGAVSVAGLVPVGRLRPPQKCLACGMPFPWAQLAAPTEPENPFAPLETMLRRLPRTIRQLRNRHDHRPPFRVEDEFDLEDLLRGVLPLHFDHVRLHRRTPGYSSRTRTDFWIEGGEGKGLITVAVKCVSAAVRERQLGEQIEEDIAYYERNKKCPNFVVFLYDPQAVLTEPSQWEAAWSRYHDPLDVHCVIAS
jgi:hypothetical protein